MCHAVSFQATTNQSPTTRLVLCAKTETVPSTRLETQIHRDDEAVVLFLPLQSNPAHFPPPAILATLLTMQIPLAQTVDGVTRTVVWQWPASPLGWAIACGAFALAVWSTWTVYRRDGQEISVPGRYFLTTLRLFSLAVLAVIALNPSERTQREAFRPSVVALVVDTSTSMEQPADDPGVSDLSRVDVIQSLVADSALINSLRESHVVDIYTFDETLADEPIRLPRLEDVDSENPAPLPDWSDLTRPRGPATRLGDAVDRVLADGEGDLLAGVVVLSDGAGNAGRDIRPANARARRNEIKLFAVGVGGTQPPINVRLSRLVVPTDVQAGDRFELTALLQGQGVVSRQASVELIRKSDSEPAGEVIGSEQVTMPEDGQPIEVKFDDVRTEEGEFEYTARIRLADATSLIESRTDDNEQSRNVRVFDRPFEVLVVAGGPMRDYRFAHTALHRHPSAEVDIWLQTGQPGISQDSREVLFEFPQTREDLFKYDIILAFDPDWALLTEEQLGWIRDWISDEGAGMLVMAGDVFTPRVASGDDEYDIVRTLLPVVLEPVRASQLTGREAIAPYPLQMTDEGRSAEFLRLDDDARPDESAWDLFPGVFAVFPTLSSKAGATIYARSSDPIARGADGGAPVIAEQRYGQGTVVYLGTSEFWRLRSLDEDWYERLWVKLVRKTAQGRSTRGLGRGLLLLDGRDAILGQAITLRARVLDAQFRPLSRTDLPLNITAPDGRPVTPPVVLKQDRSRPSEYSGDFRPSQSGTYQIQLDVPDSDEVVTGELRVEQPRLEAASMTQDVDSLKRLVDQTGGTYLTADEASTVIPEALPAMGQTFLVDRRTTPLWDKSWMLGLFVSLLGLEWLLRKLWTLA